MAKSPAHLNLAFLGRHSASAPLLQCVLAQLGSGNCNAWIRSGHSSLEAEFETETNGHSAPPLVVSGPQSDWHARLVEENPGWLAHSWKPQVERALQNLDIRYCSNYGEAIALVSSLTTGDMNADDFQSQGNHRCSPKTSLFIAHDLLRILLQEEAEHSTQGGDADMYASSGDFAGGQAMIPSVWRFRSGMSEREYFSLMAAMRQAGEQISAIGDHPIRLFIYEPLLSDKVRILSHQGEIEVQSKLRDGIEWMFNIEAASD